jgi:hypothetical protein
LHYKRWWKHGDPLGKRKLNDGRSHHPLYQLWKDMIRRCTTRDKKGNYLGRGIDVCSRWRKNFWAFVADMGARPSPKHSIERIDNDGDYEPGNCRWATTPEQARNTRRNRSLTVNGKAKLLTDWANEIGVDRRTISARLKWGWSEQDAVTIPINTKYHRKMVGAGALGSA